MVMEDREIILFLSDDLLHKWGFMDGDILRSINHENIPEYTAVLQQEIELDILPKDGQAFYFVARCLEIIIRKYIVPRIPDKIVLKRVGGHNPVRAKTINGEPVDDYQYPAKIKIKPEFFEIPVKIIVEEARKLWENPRYFEPILDEFPDP